MKKVLSIVCLSFLSAVTNADWVVDQKQSSINFLSTKKEHVTEVHSFDSFSGGISNTGKAGIKIDLSSVNTGIEIRNQRMMEYLFDVKQFATAQLTADVPMALLERLKKGDAVTQVMKGRIDLHGMTQELSAKVKFINTASGLHVSSVEPLLISAKQFSLSEGVDALRELVNLDSISYTVPVTFSLLLIK